MVANTRLIPTHLFLAWKSGNRIVFLESGKKMSIVRNFYAWLME